MDNADYVKKAQECVDAAEKIADPDERAALLKVASCHLLLAHYVAARQDHGTAHRQQDQPSCGQRFIAALFRDPGLVFGGPRRWTNEGYLPPRLAGAFAFALISEVIEIRHAGRSRKAATMSADCTGSALN